MKKKILGFVLAICLIFPCTFLMSACGDGITDCAYVQFVPASGEYVQYSAMMNSSYTHIYLFESEEVKNNSNSWDSDALITISFNRNLGVDYEIDEKDTLVVDIENVSTMYMKIKSNYFYSNLSEKVRKQVYLNDVNITEQAKISVEPEEDNFEFRYGIYSFENFGLVKGNESEYINKISFR